MLKMSEKSVFDQEQQYRKKSSRQNDFVIFPHDEFMDEDGLIAKKSEYVGSGLGLYARRKIEKNMDIRNYRGSEVFFGELIDFEKRRAG